MAHKTVFYTVNDERNVKMKKADIKIIINNLIISFKRGINIVSNIE